MSDKTTIPVANEREACAQIVDGLAARCAHLHDTTPARARAAWAWDKQRDALLEAAGAIRAQGQANGQ